MSLISAALKHSHLDHQVLAAPSQEQQWTCLKRCLQFDEPAERWEKLKTQVIKLLRNNGYIAVTKEWEVSTLEQQEKTFASCFNHNGALVQANLFSALLALEDFSRWEPIAFEIWYRAQIKSTQGLVHCMPNLSALTERVAEHLDLSVSQQYWFQHCISLGLPWHILAQDGPWKDAPGFAGIVRLWESVAEAKEFDFTTLVNSYAHFKKLISDFRFELPDDFLPELLLLVEGQTELLLLPHFSRIMGMDLSHHGVHIWAAGGVNQVLRRYLAIRDMVKLPIVMVLDSDATDQAEILDGMLRDCDRLIIWQDGEIEDTIETSILLRSINALINDNHAGVVLNLSDIPPVGHRSEALNKLWRNRGLGSFNKLGLATYLCEAIRQLTDIPVQARALISAICNLVEMKTNERPS